MAEWVGVTGSRGYRHFHRVTDYITALPKDTVLVFGDATGVDTMALGACCDYGYRYQVLRAEWRSFGKIAGPYRNEAIVRCADRLVAFWDGQSPGTKDCITQARRYGKPVEIIGDDDG